MKYEIINEYKIFAFLGKKQFLNYILEEKNVILIAMNAEKLLNEDINLRRLVNNNIGYCDGVGAVLACKLHGLKVERIPGVEFWLDIIQAMHFRKKFYFIGSTNQIINKTIKKLKIDFPQIDIVGYQNGYLNNLDKEILIKNILLTKPDIIFIAQGSPKQEFLMEELMEYYPALYMGLGGSFDIYCGEKRRAPAIFQNMGLEWFYRLLKEPTRIKRQILLLNFVLKLFFKKL